MYYNVKKARQIFATSLPAETMESEVGKALPAFAKGPDGRKLKSWSNAEIALVGEQIGFLRKPKTPKAVSVFVTKGGVLKTSLTLNLARMAAFHNIKTCVVGLDMQGDITTALGFDGEPTEQENLDGALSRINSVQGLSQVFSGNASLDDVILPTDLPCLSLIPETPELVALDQALSLRNRREYWLKENIVEQLKQRFDLVLIDCSPNWNRLITNALVASDLLISPVECKINNFRNLNLFRTLLAEFQKDMGIHLRQVYIPTKLSPSRKLSAEIFNWYLKNLPNCISTPVRETSVGEEASALNLSACEFQSASDTAQEMRNILQTVFKNFENVNVKEFSSESEIIHRT